MRKAAPSFLCLIIDKIEYIKLELYVNFNV